jgi:hypothetical protein
LTLLCDLLNSSVHFLNHAVVVSSNLLAQTSIVTGAAEAALGDAEALAEVLAEAEAEAFELGEGLDAALCDGLAFESLFELPHPARTSDKTIGAVARSANPFLRSACMVNPPFFCGYAI